MTLDKNKTKAQLIDELVELRKRLVEQASGSDGEMPFPPQAKNAQLREHKFTDAALDAQLDTFFLFEPATGKAVRWNRSFRNVSGYSDEEIAKLPAPNSYYGPEDLKRAGAFVQKVLEEGTGTIELELICKNGCKVPTEYRVSVITGERGEPKYIISIGRDITERKQAEENLRRQAAIVDCSTDMLALLDRDFTYLFANEAYVMPFGKTVDEVLGQTVSDVFGEEFFNIVIRPNAERCLTGEEVRYQDWFEFPVTGRTHMDITYEPYVGPDNEVVGFVVNGRDTTERKLAEEALRESEQLLRAFRDSATDGFVVHDSKLNVVDVNRAALTMFGVNKEEVIGKNLADFTEPSRYDKYVEVLRTGKPFSLDDLVPHPRYGDIHVTVNAFKVGDGLGIIFSDITERKQAEQERLDLETQVQQAQKLESLGVLAGGIAHDFNNLLVGVLGNADLALADLSPVSPATVSIEKVREAATRAAELANQMLAYSGKGQFVVKTVSLSDVVQEMGHLLNAAIPKTTILKYQLDEATPPIEADVTQIRQVVMNLITNASESLHDESGIAKLTTGVMECDETCQSEDFAAGECTEGTYAYLEVSDTGVGMDDETIDKIFDPFFTTKFTGRGLGLAAVFGIVRGHNATIRVESKLGEGTAIRVLFPVTDKPAESTRDSGEAEAIPTVGGTVLLVDDEPTVLDVGARMLDKAGYKVKTARDGVEAVEVFKEHSQNIDCVILDLTMPRMGGEETFVELKKIRNNVPVFLSSGYNVGEVEELIFAKGFAGFIKKPYQLNELKESIANVLSE